MGAGKCQETTRVIQEDEDGLDQGSDWWGKRTGWIMDAFSKQNSQNFLMDGMWSERNRQKSKNMTKGWLGQVGKWKCHLMT